MTNTQLLLDHLLTHGPCTDQELFEFLVASGRTKAKTSAGVKSTLDSSRLALRRADGRWDTAARRLDGCVLTFRPRSRIRDDVLWVHSDAEPLEILCSQGIPLVSGGSVRWGTTPVRTLIGPPGWLPQITPDQLIALRWDGTALQVEGPVDVPPLDDPRVRRARQLLHAHVQEPRQLSWREPQLGSWTAALLSALHEAPDLLAEPLPPLSELLPLPEDLALDPSLWESHREGRRLTVHLPDRVYHELQRRADLLGDRVTELGALLLGAAVDRLRPERTVGHYAMPYQDDAPAWTNYPDDEDEDVIPLERFR